MRSAITAIIGVFFILSAANAQSVRDSAAFIDYKNSFWEKIKDESERFNKNLEKKEDKLSFKMKFDAYDLPTDIEEYTVYDHISPISQGWTGTCWCFATTSFLESEVMRIYDKEIDISELYTVYWEYVEKARRYVRERGNSLFAQGSQGNAVLRMWDKYGCVPAKSYTGLLEGRPFHDHHLMYKEMKTYLESVKENSAWNEEVVLQTIKTIMNGYIGEPPAQITYEGKTMTPKEFLKNVVKLNTRDYVDVMSLLELPYGEKVVYPAEDNWWKSKEYNNVPLDDFMAALKKAVESGYTMMIGGDVSETGYNSAAEVAMVPSYDIPYEYIDQYARQFRWSNNTTTDDHAIHLVGFTRKDGFYWFLIKDSGSGSRNGKNEGYYFYREDYIKLKIMNFMVHKSALGDLLD